MAALLEENQTHPQPNGGATKRQRRLSVRLADPGGGDLVYYDPFLPRQQRRSTKKRRQQRPPPSSETQKVSKETLSVINNNNNNKSKKSLKDLKKKSGVEENGEESDGELDGVAIGLWKTRVSMSKSRKKLSNGGRVNLGSKVVDENRDEAGNGEVGRDFEPIREDEDEDEDEEEEEGEENHDDSSPVRSMDKDGSDNNDDDDDEEEEEDDVNENGNGVERGRSGKDLRFRVSDEMDDELSDLSGKEGVKVWLRKLGLQRYGPVFEIHEVDDEVLPLLTLEDLKDMGITAVGSRRKMISSIQNLDKGFC